MSTRKKQEHPRNPIWNHFPLNKCTVCGFAVNSLRDCMRHAPKCICSNRSSYSHTKIVEIVGIVKKYTIKHTPKKDAPLEKLTRLQLREKCKERKLAQTGNKQQLLDRLNGKEKKKPAKKTDTKKSGSIANKNYKQETIISKDLDQQPNLSKDAEINSNEPETEKEKQPQQEVDDDSKEEKIEINSNQNDKNVGKETTDKPPKDVNNDKPTESEEIPTDDTDPQNQKEPQQKPPGSEETADTKPSDPPKQAAPTKPIEIKPTSTTNKATSTTSKPPQNEAVAPSKPTKPTSADPEPPEQSDRDEELAAMQASLLRDKLLKSQESSSNATSLSSTNRPSNKRKTREFDDNYNQPSNKKRRLNDNDPTDGSDTLLNDGNEINCNDLTETTYDNEAIAEADPDPDKDKNDQYMVDETIKSNDHISDNGSARRGGDTFTQRERGDYKEREHDSHDRDIHCSDGSDTQHGSKDKGHGRARDRDRRHRKKELNEESESERGDESENGRSSDSDNDCSDDSRSRTQERKTATPITTTPTTIAELDSDNKETSEDIDISTGSVHPERTRRVGTLPSFDIHKRAAVKVTGLNRITYTADAIMGLLEGAGEHRIVKQCTNDMICAIYYEEADASNISETINNTLPPLQTELITMVEATLIVNNLGQYFRPPSVSNTSLWGMMDKK